MKRLCVFLALFAFAGFTLLHAQTVQITGTVTSTEDGMPIPGVSVMVKGTTIGTSTDIDGKYSLGVPQSATTLVFSFVGIKTQEVVIAGRTVIDVVLEPETLALEEIVVTALGITREKKALGYAVQDVKGEELAKVRTSNIVSTLSGRVAGVQITSATGQMGGGARITVRGMTSLTGNNQPLYVVDGIPLDNSDFSGTAGATGYAGYDMGNAGADINPDDVESVSILKGASATALYGSRAANGVVMITTKKAKLQKQKEIGVSVNSQVTFENIAIYPKYQKLYGGGEYYDDDDGGLDGFLTWDGPNGQTYRVADFATDESWGPAYDPNILVLQFNAFDEWDEEHYLKPTPWVYPKNDYTYFFNTGVGYQNNIQINGGNENGAFRASYTNYQTTGITPNSEMKRNTLSFSGIGKFGDMVDSWINASFVSTEAKGRPETGYGDRSPVQKMWQWIHTSVDYKDMSDYKNPDGTQRSWNRGSADNPVPLYTDNPYWSVYENYQDDRRDRVFGNTGVNIKLAPWLKLTGRMGIDFYDLKMRERLAVGSQATSEYSEQARSVFEKTLEAFFTADQRFSDDLIGLSAIIGTSRYDREAYLNGGWTDGGLILPNLYTLSNSKNLAQTWDSNSRKRINSIYSNLTFDYNRLVYLDLALRNDHSSTLPKENRSYIYYSGNLSFILSELDALKSMDFLSFAKLRAGYAVVGNDTNPYSDRQYYSLTTPFGGDPRIFLPSTLPNLELRPEQTKAWEIGAEVNFLNNRLGLEVSYFNKVTVDQIIPIQVSATTGYASFFTNAGQMTNKGLEVVLNGTPVKTKDFEWFVNLNVATLHNTVDEISDKYDLQYLTLQGAPFKVQIGAYKGETYPIIYGTDFQTDDKGNKLITPTGAGKGRIRVKPIGPIGKVTPDFTAGLTNTFMFKGVDFSFLIDMQKGGHMYYLSHCWAMYSGILEESAAINANGKNIREPVPEGGGYLYDGVYGYLDPDGNVVYTDGDGNVVDSPVKNETYIPGQIYAALHYSGPDTQNVFKTDFFKLREVRLGYTIPSKFTGPIKGLRLSAFGRNLAIWGNESKHFDPEYLQVSGSNAQGAEGGYIPSTRTYGFSLNFNF